VIPAAMRSSVMSVLLRPYRRIFSAPVSRVGMQRLSVFGG